MSEPITFHGHHPACFRPDDCACIAQPIIEANDRISELEAQCAAMREARVAGLEEAARVAERCTCAAINPSWEAAQEAIAAAIRELKEEP